MIVYHKLNYNSQRCRKMMILQLRYFVEAVRKESFSKVAEKYMVPPSSVSHTISKLEEELGTQLFARCGNKITPNDYGRIFYEQISKALDSIDDGKMLVEVMHNQTVCLTLRQCAYGVIPMLSEFKKARPDINIFFPVKPLEQKGSFFIRISAIPFDRHGEFCYETLFSENIRLAVPSSSPLAEKGTLTFEDIRNEPVVWFSEAPECDGITDYYRSRGGEPNILIACAKDVTVAEFVRNGFGIAFYPELTSPVGKAEGVTTVPLEGFSVKKTVAAAWPREFSLTEASGAFINFAVEYFRNRSAE